MCMSKGTIVAGVALNFADLHHVAVDLGYQGGISDYLTQRTRWRVWRRKNSKVEVVQVM